MLRLDSQSEDKRNLTDIEIKKKTALAKIFFSCLAASSDSVERIFDIFGHMNVEDLVSLYFFIKLRIIHLKQQINKFLVLVSYHR